MLQSAIDLERPLGIRWFKLTFLSFAHIFLQQRDLEQAWKTLTPMLQSSKYASQSEFVLEKQEMKKWMCLQVSKCLHFQQCSTDVVSITWENIRG